MKSLIKKLITAGALTYGVIAFSDPSVAVVNLTQVFQQVPQGQVVFQKIQGKFQPQANTLQHQQDVLNKEIQIFQANQAHLTQAQQKDQSQNLLAQQQQLQKKINDYQSNVKQRQEQLLKNFSDVMNSVIAQLAKKNSYHLVLSSQTAIYDDNTVDITGQVIEGMQEKNSWKSWFSLY